MTGDRTLDWDGCSNTRDLGGLPTRDGQITRLGSLVRSDNPARLTAAGWEQLRAYGIRTTVCLRTDGMPEEWPAAPLRPSEVAEAQAAIEDFSDQGFIERWIETDLWGTPLYFRDALERWPQRHAAALAAIAHAGPGGVLFHCQRGHDRTGIVSLLLLALADVTPEAIVADYELSVDPVRETLMQARGTSNRESIFETLAWLEPRTYLLSGGLSPAEIEAVRARLRGPQT